MDLLRRLRELTGASSIRELGGGHQSRVFEVVRSGERLVVKVRSGADVDGTAVTTRAEVTADLAAIHPPVCGPVRLDGRLVSTLEDDDGALHLVTCCPYADGTAPDPARPTDAARMGRALAGLHAAMASLDPRPLPLVAALLAVRPDWDGPTQLLHGDFNAGNLCVVDDEVRIFDFDDCGYGPPAFDVANALYMVLFDDLTGGRAGMYPSFRDTFLAAYEAATDTAIDADELQALIDLRVDALERWLDEPSTAPAGIRNASPGWHETLRAFVIDHRGGAGRPG